MPIPRLAMDEAVQVALALEVSPGSAGPFEFAITLRDNCPAG